MTISIVLFLPITMNFLTGIKLIQEIDLDLSRSDIFVQNTRRMLEASKKQITIISFVMNVL